MPDISKYLNAIMEAEYGEQVRGSIHDAIKVINDYATNLSTFEKVDTLPSVEEANERTLYLVWNEKSEHYDMYAKIQNETGQFKMEWLDDTVIDLSNYVSIDALNKAMEGVQKSTPTAVLDISNWDEDKRTTQYLRLLAKFTIRLTKSSIFADRIGFMMSTDIGSPEAQSEILMACMQVGGRLSGVFTYYDIDPNIAPYTGSSMFGVFPSSTKELLDDTFDIYCATEFRSLCNISINNLNVTPGVVSVEWICDENKYVDKAMLSQPSYEFYQFDLYPSTHKVLSASSLPVVDSGRNGAVPKPDSARHIFATNKYSNTPNWRDPGEIDIPTLTEEEYQELDALLEPAESE